jgi:hypothetical protein
MHARRHRAVLALAIAAAASAVAATPLAIVAQEAAGPQPYRFTVEGYLSQMSLDSDASSRTGLGGFGVRAMFNRSTVAAAARSFFDRASAGAFWTYAKKSGVSFNHIGGEVDVALVPAPINGRFDPLISLGAGIFRASAPSGVSGAKLTSSDFAITPGAGIRIPFFSGIGARGDLRAPIVFGESTSVNFVAEGGIYVSF